MTPQLVPYDAIGNDVLGMADCLRRAGFRVEIYTERAHPDFQNAAEILDFRRQSFWNDDKTLVIYHLATAWPAGQEILSRAEGGVVIKYHSVTPPGFFEAYSPAHVSACALGERATAELALTPGALFWTGSRFNASVLTDLGAPKDRCRLLAPFHRAEQMASAPMDPAVVHACKQLRATKLLFVGGFEPNKGHHALIRVLAAYILYLDDPYAVLILPGSFDPRLAGYVESLKSFARSLGIESNVIFAGPVDESQLRAYYFCADAFLCLSEHEGFCVPLVEAMHFRLPVVTHRCTAIPETIGDAGFAWEQGELECIVESVALCAEHDDRRRAVVESGWQRYSRHYSQKNLERRLLSLVEQAMPA